MATELNVREARQRLAELLDAVAAGDEVVILRHGKPAARMVRGDPEPVRFPDRSSLRGELPPMRDSAGTTVRRMREEERY